MKKFSKIPIIKRIRHDLAYVLIRAVIGYFRLMPRKMALATGSAFGKVAPLFARTDYRRSIEHLTIAYGKEKSEAEIHALARMVFVHVAWNFIDLARIATMSEDDIKALIIPHNIDSVKDTLKEGRGILALTSHTGCWELLGSYLAAVGIPIAVISTQLYDPRLEALLLASRKHGGMKNISRGQNTREIIKAIRDGWLVGILIDQDTKVKGVFVEFFGKKAHTALSPALLTLKYNVPIVPIMTYRDENHNHHAVAGKAIEIIESGDREKDMEAIITSCSKVTEDFIREHPEQWVWFHRRWKKHQ